MSTTSLIALVGGVVVSLAIRLSNVVAAWVARVLKVPPPEPVVDPMADTPATGA